MDQSQIHLSRDQRDAFDRKDGVEPLGKTFLDFLSVLTKWRRFIARFVLSVTILTVAIALVLPKWYKSTASVFPVEQTSIFSGLEGVSSLFKTLSGASTKRLGGLAGNSESDRYVAIVKSDRVINAMIDKFHLTEYYDFSSSSYALEKTSKELVDNTVIDLQDEGNLTVSVYDKDPRRAAEMANYYVELLNQTNSELMVQNARGNREFIEQRYQTNLSDLRSAEEAMKDFQVKYGIIAVPEQTQATIKAGAELYGTLAAKEIERDVLKRTTTASHPSLAEAEIEVDEIKKKLRDMNSGSIVAGDEMNIFVPFKKAPELGAQYVRLYRDLQIQNKILEFITPMYEQAKVEEHRNTPSVVVLDHASIPERKAKPKISLYALLAFVGSTLVSLLLVSLMEGIERLRLLNPERYDQLLTTARTDWFGLRMTRSSVKNGTKNSP